MHTGNTGMRTWIVIPADGLCLAHFILTCRQGGKRERLGRCKAVPHAYLLEKLVKISYWSAPVSTRQRAHFTFHFLAAPLPAMRSNSVPVT